MLYVFHLRLASGVSADPPKAELAAAALGTRLRDHAHPTKRLRVLDQDGDTLTVEPIQSRRT